MPYDAALNNGWKELEKISQKENYAVYFLCDEYSVDIKNKRILLSLSNAPAKEYVSIIILHYLARKIKGLPKTQEEWISFLELAGGQGYYPTFKKRVIDKILKKYADKPENILGLVERFKAKTAQLGDFSVVLEPLEGIPVLITLWRADEEFSATANINFAKNINQILCTEDIVVMAEFIAAKI